ncbi:MAG: methylmalonyl Co-A mutase-associated GTPase MeaB [Saprospiraceae bacterium]|nr:methylmalonyl Co-A mutase-associated GTPase MeaB [Saprospiraceae bacterium]
MLSTNLLSRWIQEIQSGNRQSLSKAITLIESQKAEDRVEAVQLLKLLKDDGNSLRVGITGPPGVGKSSLIEALGQIIVAQGYKLAVLSIDPSSNLTKGSLLGDKTRMQELSQSSNAYIRPSPTGSQWGGISGRTRECIRLCEAGGYDYIFIETTGVGQTEYLVSTMVDLTLLLHLPGSGDELQGIKKGIMEWADILVVHKADLPKDPGVIHAIRDLTVAIQLLEPRPSGYQRFVIPVSSQVKIGLDLLWDQIQSFHKHIKENGYMFKNRNEQLTTSFKQLLQQETWNSIAARQEISNFMAETEKKLKSLILTPEEAVEVARDFIFAVLKK